MAYILAAQAAIRAIVAEVDDPLSDWIRDNELRPLITAATISQVHYAIATDPDLTHAQRTTFRRLTEEMVRDLDSRTEAIVANASFGMDEALILSEILDVDVTLQLGELDLIPAAIAIRRGHDLVVASQQEEWVSFSDALAPEIGRLRLKVF